MKIIIKILMLCIVINLKAQNQYYIQEFYARPDNYSKYYITICNPINDNIVIGWNHVFLYAQIYDIYGNIQSPRFQVYDSTGAYFGSSMTTLSDSGFVICWCNNSNGDEYPPRHIFQVFNNDGSKNGNEITVQENVVVGTLMGGELYPKISSNNESILITWSQPSGAIENYQIFYKIFDQNFNVLSKKRRLTIDSLDHTNPNCVNLKDSKYAICWQTENQAIPDGYFSINVQIIEQNGDTHGSIIQVSTHAENYLSTPCIAGLKDGGFAVTWRRFQAVGDDFTSDIFVQIFDENYNKIDNAILVGDDILGKNYLPRIVALSEGGFLVCWFRQIDEYTSGIFGQLFNDSGEKNGTELRLDNETGYPDDPIGICSLSKGGFVVASPFRYSGGPYNSCDIYVKSYIKPIIHKFLPFSLLKPENDSVVKFLDTNFIWSKPSPLPIRTPKELEYILYVDDEASYSCPEIISSIYDTTYHIQNLEPGTKYYWKVLTKNLDGDSLWSNETNSFSVGQSLISFSLLQPYSDETVKFTNPTLTWNHASGQSFNSPWKLDYHVYFDKNEDFSDPEIYSVVRDTSCIVDSLLPGTTYFWKVLAKDTRNDSLWSTETNLFYVSEDATVDIKDKFIKNKSQTFELYSNYPNPFNPETTIKYNLPADQSVYPVKVKIYDALGRLIVTLKDALQNPGLHTVKWNGKNITGQSMPSGIYFCVVEAGPFKATQKMLLLR